MRYVKVFEAWSEEKEEEVPHKDLYEMLEELVNAWKEWKENDDEDKDEDELHDEFMEKVEDLIERAKEIVEEEEEEEEEPSEEQEEDESSEEEEDEEETEEEPEETEEEDEVEESRDYDVRSARKVIAKDLSDLGQEIEKYRGMTDLSTIKGTLASMVKPLIPEMDSMTGEEILERFLQILDDPNLSASQATKDKNRNIALSKTKTVMEYDPNTDRRVQKTVIDKNGLMFFITGLHMRGSKLPSDIRDYRP